MTGATLRRALHASSALVLVAVPLHSWQLFRALVVGALALTLAVDIVRLTVPAINERLWALVPVFRASEISRVSGATWLWLGYAIAAWLPAPASAAGVLVAALADPAAAAMGERLGRGPGKTWAGSVTALAVACVALAALQLPWPAVAAGAVVGAALERWPVGLDDNLIVPPGVALAVLLLA